MGEPDRIELRGLRVLGLCGLLPEELTRVQPLEVDLDVMADLARPGETDAVDDTIDYGALCAMIERIIREERFDLLEALARRLAGAVMADERVEAVTVVVRKLRPPVPQQLDTCGVRIPRTRAQLA